METRGRARLWNGLRRYATTRQVVAALIAVLLAGLLVGQVVAQEASGAAWRGRGGPRQHMVVKPERAGQHLALRGGRPRHRVAVQRSSAPQRVAARPVRRAAAI